MKYIILLLILSGCSSATRKESSYRFGDTATVASGKYQGSRFTIQDEMYSHSTCKEHLYYGMLQRNGIITYDYICHENLGGLW